MYRPLPRPVRRSTDRAVVEKIVTPTAIPTPAGGIKRGGTLYTGLNYTTDRFTDPALATNTFQANVVRQVCDWLVKVGTDMKVKPSLATDWAPSADGLKWTLHLRKGVKFNHGKAFTADDVVFTFNRMLTADTASAFKSVANYLQPGSIQKVDDFTVVFTCDRVVGDRGLTHGRVYAADGRHVATIAQEVLVRRRRR